jgi:Zn-dependent metalloprotease
MRRDQFHHCRRNPLHCIVPPHMLNEMALNSDDPDRRAIALATLSASHSLTGSRLSTTEQVRFGVFQGLGFFGEMAGAGLPHKTRTIYTAGNTQRLPGTVVRREGQAPVPNDDPVNQAYDYMGDTFDFYWQVFGRDSIDDNGMPLNGTVHFGRNYDNAYWDGRRMVYGDGDGTEFTPFTTSVDVIGHELTHGVTQFEAGLFYFGQSGAINESISDVFGSMVRQYSARQNVKQADWLIGAELFVDPDPIKRRALRDMANPGTAYNDNVLGKDPQPADMSGYVRTLDDNGGVHINSGIPNRAFYLAASEIGGNSWEGAGPVWYQALLSPMLRRNASFRSFAGVTVASAGQLYGPGSSEAEAVREAWRTVGVQV